MDPWVLPLASENYNLSLANPGGSVALHDRKWCFIPIFCCY